MIYMAQDQPLEGFSDPWIMQHIMAEFNVSLPFCLDSFSDSMQFGLAQKIFKTEAKKLLIILFDRSQKIKGLNSLLKLVDSSTSILVFSPSDGPILPIKMSTKYFSERKELKVEVGRWIQENSKESESF